ncbi:uncharacterized protein LOC123547523 [Mercenaria mercenaria]|uniref:uncharacterized protein LOC123547523 n=1 Tax=Mercenaria mercenaria TaxID=6596 RepID=UPI00234E9AB6|nr:uncharacterized protein LOC123547523 [Mercenaria mercenaria]
MRMAGGKKYPDLRYLFMRGLINHERDQRCHHYLKSAAECTSRAVVSLELADEPIRSVKQARRLEGIGGETCSRLTKLEKEKEFSCLKPLAGRFVSSAGGILVGLLDATEEIRHHGNCSPDKSILVPEGSVKTRAIRLTEEQFAEGPNDFCKAWWRLEVLIKRGYVRRRSQKKSAVLQLMPIGKDIATRLRAQNGLTSTVPDIYQTPGSSYAIPRLPLLGEPGEITPLQKTDLSFLQSLTGETTLQEQKPKLEDALYTNDRGLDGIVMLVDRREMGGEKNGLGELCGLLGDNGICYKTQHLKAGDYSWLWRVNGKEIVLPCLVERKRADDIARTLKEGRFWSQVNRMKEWKEGFIERGIQCAIHYILERKPEEYVVRCEDGCQGIIQCGNPTLTQVKLVIEDLKRHPDLLVKETDSLNVTVILLASLTAELRERVKKGDFDNLLQSELSEKKPQPCAETSLHTSSYVDDVVTKTKNVQAKNLVPADLLFDEEMRLAIERSKTEISEANNVLDSIPDIYKDHRKQTVSNTDKKTLHVVDDDKDIDADLAMVLERSKYDTRRGGEEAGGVGRDIESEHHPLMQYHCTEGGSLHYPSSGGKSREKHTDAYRPKINRKQTVSSSGFSKQNVYSNFESENMNVTSVNEVPLNGLNSSRVCYKNDVNSSHLLNVNSRGTRTDTTQNTYSDSIWKDTVVNDHLLYESPSENKKPVKRKYYKKEFIFKPDENFVDESYSSNSDSESLNKKKPRTAQFSFTPAKECIETNVLQTAFSKGIKDTADERRCHQTPRNVLGKVYRMRRVKDEVLHTLETEPSLSYSKKVKVKTETGCSDDIEKLTTDHDENDQVDGYNSGDDLFADKDDKSENKSFKEKVGPSRNLSSHIEKGANCDVKKFQKDKGKNSYVERCETRRIDYEEDVLASNVIDSEGVETGGTSRDISLSQGSESGESLPDIELGITVPAGNACTTNSSIRAKTSSRNVSPVRNSCISGGSISGKERSERTARIDSRGIGDDVNVSTRQERFDSGYDSDTSHHVNNDETEDKVKLVLSVLPHIPKYSAREMLNKCKNNVELCITELLEGNS